MRFGNHEVEITVRTPDGQKYFNRVSATEEMIDGGEHIDIYASEIDRAVTRTLNEAYDNYEFDNRDYTAQRTLRKRLIWEKVKNINTDEELEEIRELLQIHD